MENLPLDPGEAKAVLSRIPRSKAAVRKPAVEKPAVEKPAVEKPAVEKPDSNYFKIRFAPGEIIIPHGVRSDFAGLLLQGCVQVHARREVLPPHRARPEECWNQPGLLTLLLERWALDRTDRLIASEDGSMSRWDRAARSLARKLRAGLQRLEDWAVDRTDRASQADRHNIWKRGQGWIARNFLGWTRRRFRERSLATPLLTGTAGGQKEKHEKIIGEIAACDENGNERAVMERFMGLTGALWNVPRSCTLVAQNDGAGRPCELLMVKREELLKINKQSEVFRNQTDAHFLDMELAPLLVESRLFRNTFAETDIADWPGFMDQLRGKAATPHPEAVRRIRHWLMAGSSEFSRWIEDPLEVDKEARTLVRDRYQIVGALNTLLKRDDLDSAHTWPDPGAEARGLRGQPRRQESETIRLNHLLVAQAFEGVMRKDESTSADCWPLRDEQFQELIDWMRAPENGCKIDLRHHAKDDVISEQDHESEELHLIVSGTVRISKRELGGEVLVNQLERHGYFGVSCIEAGAKHSARLVAITVVNTVALDQRAVRFLMERYPALGRKLRGDLDRLRQRDALMESLDRLPPAEPPEEVASKLMLAGNLLRIDMDLCTRCDQCVRGCAEAHDGVPRFGRSNPGLRFGRWEVAKACVHCNDAPCQNACPVGAIAFLDSGAVQIHRERCIGCGKCVADCPFDVIAMVLPPTKQDIATNTISGLVATKCDLCLTDGRDPPCVTSCPYGAAERGTPRELFPEIKSWAAILSPR